MAVHYVKGSSPLGNLGMIASIAGTFTGQPWLTALGQGMNVYNSISGGYQTPGFQNTNNNPFLSLGGLFSGNISRNPDNISQRGK